jgi:hypothetical protein
MPTAKCRICQEERPGENSTWKWAVAMYRDTPFKGKYEYVCAEHLEGYCYECTKRTEELWNWERKHRHNNTGDIRKLCRDCLIAAINKRKEYHTLKLEKLHTVLLNHLQCEGCGNPNTSNETIELGIYVHRYCKNCIQQHGQLSIMKKHRKYAGLTPSGRLHPNKPTKMFDPHPHDEVEVYHSCYDRDQDPNPDDDNEI